MNNREIEIIYILGSIGAIVFVMICVCGRTKRNVVNVYMESDAHMVDICLVDVQKLENKKEIEVNV
jgi:hypothetical protein